jgi:hypothetical protein
MSDKKTEDVLGDESNKDLAAENQASDSAKPEQSESEKNKPEEDSPEQDSPDLQSSELEGSELESSELESSELKSSELEGPEPDSAEHTAAKLLSDAKASTEEINDRLEQLLPSVLDIAEATNSAADVSRKSTAALKKGLDQLKSKSDALTAASEKSAQLTSRVLIGSVAALLVSVLLYSFISVQLATRVTQVDSMLVAVSKRIVQMNSALTTFETLRTSIGELAITQSQFSDRQMLLIEAVSRAEVAARSMAAEVPSLAAQQVGEKTDQIVLQVSSLGKDLEGQGSIVTALTESVGALGKQVKSLEGQVGNVKQLNADVEALITLEREKYLEVLQRQVALEEARQTESVPVEPEPDPVPAVVTYSVKK